MFPPTRHSAVKPCSACFSDIILGYLSDIILGYLTWCSTSTNTDAKERAVNLPAVRSNAHPAHLPTYWTGLLTDRGSKL